MSIRPKRSKPAKSAKKAQIIPLHTASVVRLARVAAARRRLAPRRRVASVNPAARKLLGISPARARGAEASALLRTVVAGEDLARDAFAASHLERETVLHTPGAGDVPVLLTAQRFGRPAWVLVTLHDLTSTRRMQQELRRHERLATLGQLSAGVAHEIRNPLAGIGTSAQVLLKRLEPRDERTRFVTVILEEVERLDRIVSSLLQYPRPPP